MSDVTRILSIVNDSFLAEHRNHLSVEEDDIANAKINIDFSKIDLIEPVFWDFMLCSFVHQAVSDIWTPNIVVKINSKLSWVVCGIIGSCVIIFFVQSHIITSDKVNFNSKLALGGIFGTWVCWFCQENQIFSSTNFALLSKAHFQNWCTDLIQFNTSLISCKETITVSIEFELNFAIFMVNYWIGISISSGSSWENPCIVNFIERMGLVCCIGSTLNHNK